MSSSSNTVDRTWIRTCQECDFRQVDKQPIYGQELTSAYRERKCKKCKSEGSLDYGSFFVLTDHGWDFPPLSEQELKEEAEYEL